jgi:hypothetical protein
MLLVVFFLGVLSGLVAAVLICVLDFYFIRQLKQTPIESLVALLPKPKAEIVMPVSHEDKLAEEARVRAKSEGRDWVGLDEMYDA